MDENLELEQELEEGADDLTDVEVEDTDGDDDSDDYNFEEGEETDPADDEQLEYDEDGNVIESEEDDTNDAAAQVEERETKKPDTDTSLTSEKTVKSEENKREAIIKDILKAMGIEEKDIDAGLIRLAADTKGVTPDQYSKELNDFIKNEEAQKMYKQVMMERMVAADINELHSMFPETKDITKLEDIPNCRRYAELRDAGLSVKEAYSAANPDGRREAVANSVKQQTINASKSHLKSNVPIASKDTSVKISRAEMNQMREMFPEKSDKELIALYKKTM
jgi:hypothetical protein